jgi:hypothetical protein
MSGSDHQLYSQPWPEGDYRFFQLGFVVDDIVAAAARWAAVHGVGPFHITPVVEMRAIVAGQVAPASIQVGLAQAGPVQIELIQQHCDRPSIFRDWGSNGGGSFHQLATVTPNYDVRKAHLEHLGYELAGEILSDTLRVAYLDTAEHFGFYTELVDDRQNLAAHWQQISQTCATWDGTDPVRMLTRDGYRVP